MIQKILLTTLILGLYTLIILPQSTKNVTTVMLISELIGFLVFPIFIITASITSQPQILVLCIISVIISASELILSGITIVGSKK